MTFKMWFTGEQRVIESTRNSVGRIRAGELDEEFLVDCSEWDEIDYRSSWCRELGRLMDGADRAVLLTVALDPVKANWLRGYVLYRFDGEVRVQERIFLMDDVVGKFELSNLSASVDSYESVNEDGIRISEWRTSMEDIREYYNSKCKDSS